MIKLEKEIILFKKHKFADIDGAYSGFIYPDEAFPDVNISHDVIYFTDKCDGSDATLYKIK